jgi:hypothetical protein
LPLVPLPSARHSLMSDVLTNHHHVRAETRRVR